MKRTIRLHRKGLAAAALATTALASPLATGFGAAAHADVANPPAPTSVIVSAPDVLTEGVPGIFSASLSDESDPNAVVNSMTWSDSLGCMTDGTVSTSSDGAIFGCAVGGPTGEDDVTVTVVYTDSTSPDPITISSTTPVQITPIDWTPGTGNQVSLDLDSPYVVDSATSEKVYGEALSGSTAHLSTFLAIDGATAITSPAHDQIQISECVVAPNQDPASTCTTDSPDGWYRIGAATSEVSDGNGNSLGSEVTSLQSRVGIHRFKADLFSADDSQNLASSPTGELQIDGHSLNFEVVNETQGDPKTGADASITIRVTDAANSAPVPSIPVSLTQGGVTPGIVSTDDQGLATITWNVAATGPATLGYEPKNEDGTDADLGYLLVGGQGEVGFYRSTAATDAFYAPGDTPPPPNTGGGGDNGGNKPPVTTPPAPRAPGSIAPVTMPKKAKAGKKTTLTFHLGAQSGTTVTAGKVYLYDGKKKIATASFAGGDTSAVSFSGVKFKKGKHHLTVVFAPADGSAVVKSSSSTITVK